MKDSNAMTDQEQTLRRILLAALVAITVGVGLTSLITGFSDSWLVRLLQGLAVFGLGTVIVGGAVALALIRLADWRDPESESEFEELVQRTERLAAQGRWSASAGADGEDGDQEVEDWEADVDEEAWEEELFDVRNEEDFKALVRSAVDELPLEFHRALEHVAVVVADGGGRRHAYGLYEGDTIANDYFHDRIVIFRDTLTRDFGHDPELLRAQVTRVLRHELAHHLGWDEKGVRGLGL
jgi:predicted Zn-dependent protease with MMP-like domain